MDVFAEFGFNAGSLRGIAERVGISQAGLLHHFPTKVALLSAVLALRDEQAFDFLPEDRVDGREALLGWLDLIRHNTSRPRLVELHCALSAEATTVDHPAHAYFEARYEITVNLIQQVFEALAAADELRPGVDPGSAARTLMALSDGLQVQWLYHPDRVDMVGELRRFIDSLLLTPL
jgi:AcrR family transcriptional regulator